MLKIGGELLEDTRAMRAAANGIAALRAAGPVAVVHGGGRAIDADLRARGKAPVFIDGLRITDEDTLTTVVSVLAGRINTSFVAALAAVGVPAVGLTGADASIGRAALAPPLQTASGTSVDLGLVGLPQRSAPSRLLTDLLALDYVPIIACLGVTTEGMLLNVNADIMAAHLARALGAGRLTIAGTTAGVLDASGHTIADLDEERVRTLVAQGTAREGMVAKLGACLDALAGGVREVHIVDGRSGAYHDAAGTTIRAAATARAVITQAS